MLLFFIMACAATFQPDFGGAVLQITGASCVEELSEAELERFEALAAHPLDLNSAGRSRLLSSGLFTAFQVASLLDSRSRGGDILSWTELALTDGFSEPFTEALRCFCVLRPHSPPGQAVRNDVKQSAMLRGSVRRTGSAGDGQDVQTESAFGAKYALYLGERAELHWGSRTTYSEPEFTPGTASVCVYGRGCLGKVVAGDYSARFGQGLVQWSGTQFGGYSTVGAFSKRGSGLGAVSSFTRQMHGVGAEFEFGRWSVSAAYSWPDEIIGNVSRVGRTAAFGVTAAVGLASLVSGTAASVASGTASAVSGNAVSVDWRIGGRGLSFFGEAGARFTATAGLSAATDTTPLLLTGLLWVPAYGHKAALLCRYTGSGTSELAVGYQGPSVSATADFIPSGSSKITLLASPVLNLGRFTLTPSARAVYKWKRGSGAGSTDAADDGSRKLDLRVEGEAVLDETWCLRARYNRVWQDAASWLWYAEAGCKGLRLSGGVAVSPDGGGIGARGGVELKAFLRVTVFKADSWNDRIWSYERDCPGIFNVPAYYGRGWSLSLYAGCKFGRRHALYLRASTLQYPWNLTPKDSRTELKLQYQLEL